MEIEDFTCNSFFIELNKYKFTPKMGIYLFLLFTIDYVQREFFNMSEKKKFNPRPL